MNNFDEIMKTLGALSRGISQEETKINHNIEDTNKKHQEDSKKIDTFVDAIKKMGFYDENVPNLYIDRSIEDILNGMTSEFPDPVEDEDEIQKREERKRLKLEKKKRKEEEEQKRIQQQQQQQEQEEQERMQREAYERKHKEKEERKKRKEREELQQSKKKTSIIEVNINHKIDQNDICIVCKKPVIENKVHLKGHCCHKECFRCSKCSKPLVVYHIEGDQPPVCSECYAADGGNTCSACGKPIGNAGHVKVGDKKYHQSCFCCSYCKNMLPREHFNVEGKLYCSQGCASKAMGKVCAKCQEPLSGSVLSVLGKSYHKGCFVCAGCGAQFPALKFFPVDNEPYCQPCATQKLKGK